jgi:FtsH-binding integral membrane protein
MRDSAYDVRYGVSVAESMPAERAAFIRRTYAHLAGAILAFVALETVLIATIPPQAIFDLLATSPYSWLIVLGVFMVGGWVAQWWAESSVSPALQYAGLALYVVLQAIVFLPLLMLAWHYTKDPNVIPTAGILTLAVFGGLTLTVFTTRTDFSFLGPILWVGALIAMGVIVAGIIFGFSLGLIFSFAMVALMSGYILYYTSAVMLHYNTNQHVAAALALFAAVATLFWYILRIVMALSSRD